PVPAGTFYVEVSVYVGIFGPSIGGDYVLNVSIDEEFTTCAPGYNTCNGHDLDVCNAAGDGYDTVTCNIGCETLEGVGDLCSTDLELDANNNDQWQGADMITINVDGTYELDGEIGFGDANGYLDLEDWYVFT